MLAEGVDLSYIGVYGVWNNDLGKERNIAKHTTLTDRAGEKGLKGIRAKLAKRLTT